MLGRWDEALARLAEFESLGGTAIDATLTSPVIEIFCGRGDVAAARAWLVDNALIRTGDEDIQVRAGYLLAEAQVLRAEGRLREALETAERGLEILGTLGITYLTIKLSLVESLEAAFALGEYDKVRERLTLVDELRPGERPPLLEAHAHRFRGKLAADEGEFVTAAASFRELSLRFWLAVTLLEHGELLTEDGRADEASPLLAEARQIFEELGAQPWLERLAVHAEAAS